MAGIVLAAGSSLRMGRNKLFLEIDGESLLRRSVRAAVASGVAPVFVVVGPEPERASREVSDLGVSVVPNPRHAEGQNVSLRKGLEAVPEEAAAAVAVLADMPFVTAEMIAEVVRRYLEARPPLVVSRYGETTAPPTLYDRSLFGEFVGEACGKHVVKKHWREALLVDWPREALADLDAPADYERALARLAGRA